MRCFTLSGRSMVALAICLSTATSQGADRLVGLRACRALQDSAARLACFDQEVSALDEIKPATAPPARTSQQQFGLPEQTVVSQEVAEGSRAPDIVKIQAKVISYAPQVSSRATISLDNRQVWRQLSPADLLLAPGDLVSITRGALNSFWLQAANGRGAKVSRVR